MVKCKLCEKEGRDLSKHIKKFHDIQLSEYMTLYGDYIDDEVRFSKGKSSKGKKQSTEHLKKRVESFKKSWQKRDEKTNTKWKEKISKTKKINKKIPWNKGLKLNDSLSIKIGTQRMKETKNSLEWLNNRGKIWLNNLRKSMTKERNKKLSESRKILWKKPTKKMVEAHEKLRVISLLSNSKKSLKYYSKPELITMIFLERNDLKYKCQEILDDSIVVDFIIEDKIVLEVDGFWHKNDCPERKNIRDDIIIKHGFDLIHLEVTKKNQVKEIEEMIIKIKMKIINGG